MNFERVSLQTWLNFNNTNPNKDDSPYIDSIITTNDNYNEIVLPTRSTANSAGYDFRIPFEEIHMQPGVPIILPTGIKCNLQREVTVNSENGPAVYMVPSFLALYPRSSFGFKYGFTLLNTVAVIDADYYNNESNEGHIMVAFTVNKEVVLKKGDKFCQGIITPFYLTEDDNTNTVRTGGVGSTGK